MKPVKPVENPSKIRNAKRGPTADKIRDLKVRYPKLSAGALAKRVGCSRQNAARVVSTFMADHSEHDLRSFQQNRSDVWDSIGMRCLGSVTPGKLAKASASSLVTAAAIAEDKRRLIMGLPTGLDVHVLMDIAAMIRDKPG